MKQTFEELLKNLPGEDKINNGNQGVVIELMKKVLSQEVCVFLV